MDKIKIEKSSLVLLDIILINMAVFISLLLRFDLTIDKGYMNTFNSQILILSVLTVIIFYLFGLYRSLWEYASVDEVFKIVLACFFVFGIYTTCGFILSRRLPLSVYIAAFALSVGFVGGIRISYRLLRRIIKYGFTFYKKDMHIRTRVMIIGAGDAGSMIVKELKKNIELKAEPVIVIDDDKNKHGMKLHGVPIAGGREKIIELVYKYDIDRIIIVMPAVPNSEISKVLKIASRTSCELKTMSKSSITSSEKIDQNDVKNVDIADLLGRDEVVLNTEEISGYIRNEVVLVTGGGGSIGSSSPFLMVPNSFAILEDILSNL